MSRNAYYYRALAVKRKTPREMISKYDGICAHCHKPFSAGAAIVWYGATKSVWHSQCYFALKSAGKDPLATEELQPTPQAQAPEIEEFNPFAQVEPTPEPMPAPKAPKCCAGCRVEIADGAETVHDEDTGLDYHWRCFRDNQKPAKPMIAEVRTNGAATIKCWTDAVIKDDGKTIFFSLLGNDSIIKSMNGQFINGSARGYTDALYCDSVGYLRKGAGHYKFWPSKLPDRGAHLVCCSENFLPGISLEKEHRYLICEPGQDAQSLVFEFLRKNIATPTLPEWKPAIYAELTKYTGNRYYKPQTDWPTVTEIRSEIGELTAYKISVNEESYDALITRLIESGKISF
jgi:hypothetical protein